MHSTFGRSTLVRQLAAWSPPEGEAPAADVAERLGAWIGPLQAIGLQSLLHGEEPSAPARRGRAPATDLLEDVKRTRGVLASAIAKDPLALAGVRPADSVDAGYGPWQQRHVELQRQMGQLVDALRDHVRQAARRVPALQPLAGIDEHLQEMLAPREQALLPTLVAHLERRYRQLRSAHADACATAGLPDDPARWREPGGWLDTFAHDWRQALLAELDQRLAPVLGLAEAVRAESPGTTP